MTDRHPIAILGAGGHAKVVISTLRAAGHTIAAIFDDDEAKMGMTVAGIPVKGSVADAQGLGLRQAVIAIGDNSARERIAKSFGFEWIEVRHPTAWIDPSARVGAGTVIFARAVIQADTTLGDHVIVNTAATVDHDCAISHFAHLAPGSNLGGSVSIGKGALVGLGASIKPSISVGHGAIIGCGAAVVTDIETGIRAVGVPARPLTRRDTSGR